ncbi:MAG: 1-phosphofructokinase family hexose kinase [Firmicutes bacterium]|nr:1-phosphofructokinase family hexose kinase [Bacillota bacterium]
MIHNNKKISVCTVTLSPSLDYHLDLSELATGTLNRSVSERFTVGGKGINVTRALYNLGISSLATGFLAGFTGDRINSGLSPYVPTDFIFLQDGVTRVNVKLHHGCETEINAGGPYISPEKFNELINKLDILETGDILVLSGTIPPSLPKTSYADIMERIKDKNIHVVLDTTGDALMNALPYEPFLIKPNKSELEELFGTKIDGIGDTLFYARKLREKGAKNILVTFSEKGAILLSEDNKLYYTSAPSGVVHSTVGSGDSSVAGFIAAFSENETYSASSALALAVATGSACAFTDEFAEKDKIYSLLDSIKVTEFSEA